MIEQSAIDEDDSSSTSSSDESDEADSNKQTTANDSVRETAVSRSIVYPVTERHKHKQYKGFQVLAIFTNIESANSYARNYAKLVTDQLNPRLQERGFTNKITRTPDDR